MKFAIYALLIVDNVATALIWLADVATQTIFMFAGQGRTSNRGATSRHYIIV